ncbi:MAG: hypothetical protein KJ072_12825 [Verrucomicrobia bacterium]|nr:hypothetical protein [Verrucomicrobiota bacterium]
MKLASDPRDWQPFTFRGVAGLATGPPRRLIKVQVLAGLWVAGSLTWFLATAWWPVIDAAGGQLPNQAAIRGQRLAWEGPLPARLAENQFLAVTVDLEGNSARTSTSDLQLELVHDGIRLHSLFGHLAVPYPRGYVVQLGRMEFQPWWGARRWPLLTVISGAAFVVLLAGWQLQGACYAVWVRIFSFYADRSATVKECWRLAMAALTPSAVVLGSAVFLYGLHRLNLVGLVCAFAAQAALAWVYLLIAPFWLPHRSGAGARRRNPFRH